MSNKNHKPQGSSRGLHVVADFGEPGGGALAGAGPHKSTVAPALCQAMQEVWSSALDGEPFDEPLLAANQQREDELTFDDVKHHMLYCPNCLAVAHSTDRFRRLRVRAIEAETLPDLRPAIRSAIKKETEKTPDRRFVMVPSILMSLTITGIAQAIGALPHLFGSANGGALAISITSVDHLTREAAASEIALAVGFIYVAVKPFAVSAVRVFASVLTTLVIFSTLSSGSGGLRGAPLEAHHLIAIFGTALLWLLPSNEAEVAGLRSRQTRNPFSRAPLPNEQPANQRSANQQPTDQRSATSQFTAGRG
jgi:predicted anti-sigma-YlaC factor YlaD